VVVIMTTSTGCANRSDGPSGASIDTTTKSEELTKQVLSEEQPPIQKAQVNIGTLKQHQDGYSIGSETEWTKLKKLLSDKKNDAIEISWVWDCGPQYGNMPMKLIYDRNSGTLSRIFPSKGEGLLQDSMKNTSNTLVRKCLYIRIYENKIRLSHKDK